MYVCPTCKGILERMRCVQCAFKVDWNDGVPVFFAASPIANRYREIGLFYDALYQDRENVWKELDGRGAEFTSYVASVVENFSPKRYLDIGCGQGYLYK